MAFTSKVRRCQYRLPHPLTRQPSCSVAYRRLVRADVLFTAILGDRNSPTVFRVGPICPEVRRVSPARHATVLQTRLALLEFLVLYSRRRRTLLLFGGAHFQALFVPLP